MGRSKAQRWSDSFPAFGKSGSDFLPSFKDILLAGAPRAAASQARGVASHQVASAAVSSGAPRAAPRIVLRDEGRTTRRVVHVLEADGWTKVRRRDRRPSKRLERPRRPVPADLRGKCFNCFSPSHCAADCRLKTRCFRRRGLGYRSSACLRQPPAPNSCRPRLLVWRLVSTPVAVSASPDNSPIEAQPRRILDRSASISQRDDGLIARALVVTVLNGSADSILTTIAGRFEIEVTLLALQRFGPARFLLILPTARVLERVYNGSRPIITSSIRLHVMRWTRFLQSTLAALSFVVEVDIQGIPAHAWELSTAELLLNEYCWISGIHPDMADCRDSFRVSAWCSCPSVFPSEMELEILEPTMAVDDPQAVKRTLVYPVKVFVVTAYDLLAPAPVSGIPRCDLSDPRDIEVPAPVSGVRWRAPRNIEGPTPSSSPEGASPPGFPWATASLGPEREASTSPPLAERTQQPASPVRHTPPSPGRSTSFMARLTKRTTGILPTPCTDRIRTPARTPAAPPHRSRRIAGMEPELVGNSASSRNKKKVMRALDIIGETEGIDQQALDEYSKLFTQSSSLTASHVQALAALFG
uniref:DUF4283 domain-containing protein n=1 Tax=Setaria italica TaxID=4555 RepID=K3ZDB9_SETIT